MILVDGDPFVYRAAFSCEDSPIEDAVDKLDDLIEQALEEVKSGYTSEDYKVFVTGRGNFRKEIATSFPYKGNRKDKEKPQHLKELYKHIKKNWSAITSKGEEADDLIGIGATEYGQLNTTVISIDKDMLQLPCLHYNPNRKLFKAVSEKEGLKFFYTQILTGDSVDNIIGLKGVGPVKADKMLEGLDTDKDLFDKCVEAYEGNTERVIENARLLWLRRFEGQIWEPPE